MAKNDIEAKELRDKFLGYINEMIEYWDEQDASSRAKLEGLAHSILVAIDGESATLPPFDLVSNPGKKLNISKEASLHDEFNELRDSGDEKEGE